LFFAMEVVEGQTMRRWLESDHTTEEICAAFVQVASGLAATHQHNILHRDIKPDNLIIDVTDQRVRILDFGLARLPQEIAALTNPNVTHVNSSISSSRLTAKGAVMGTPAYIAPEQARGAPTDPRTDQFSFCVSMFEALTGRLPFNELTERGLQEGEALPYPERSATDATWLWSILRRGLAADPERRWPSMAALQAALDTATTMPDEPDNTTTRRRGGGILRTSVPPQSVLTTNVASCSFSWWV